MKKLTLFFAVILAFYSAQAQITITNADMPQPGTANIVAFDTISMWISELQAIHRRTGTFQHF